MKTTQKHPSAQKHGPIENLFDGIWFVQGGVKMPMWMPMHISRSMTVVKDLQNGHLCLFNSMRLSEAGLAELEKLGPIKHVIRLGGFHGRDDGFYRDRYGAQIWAFRGQVYTRKLDAETTENYMEPDHWIEDEDQPLPLSDLSIKIIKSSKPVEALVLVDRNGGILVSGDALQNTPQPDQFVNFLARLMMKKMGFFKAYNIGPGWLQFAKPDQAEVRSIADLTFEHVLPGHGKPVIGQARQKYLPALTGPLKGCHDKSA
ncbi:MAG: hypothetical protein KDC71_02235 [Acidobacteria bacterium]|nr:hypothetical protein [Acidobacteriota bacterium]